MSDSIRERGQWGIDDWARRNVFSGVLKGRRSRPQLLLGNCGREICWPQRIFYMERRISLKGETKLD